ncbi:MAG: hypothetical protein PHY14_01725 [Candidatus Gracilibacteria bacterium]|nr:hypothetical protein [Candidatus Gracilibacteria bacterium]
MWLIRFQNIETRDYHRVERFCHQVDFVPKKFSAMLLTKGILLYVFQKKSWRQIGKELNVPHLSVYNFYSHIQDSDELHDFLLYFIERRIVLSIADERNITREYLETDEIVEKSKMMFLK